VVLNPWDFGWEAIAALAGVIAVVVASVLGWLGVRLAAKAVHRSKLDYLGQRADVVAGQLERLRRLYGEFDTALLPFWEKRPSDGYRGEKPDFAPAQGKLLELQAACGSLELAVRGLTATNAELGGSSNSDSAATALDALYIATDIGFLYFASDGGGNTRETLNRLYDSQLENYEPKQRDAVNEILTNVGPDVRVPNTVTSVSRGALSKCVEDVTELVIKAFEVAGSDGGSAKTKAKAILNKLINIPARIASSIRKILLNLPKIGPGKPLSQAYPRR
jgi:hypothetical protein